MIVMCAWCKKIIRIDKPYTDLRISHGICDKCYKKNFNKGGKKDEENKFLKERKDE